MHWNFKKETPYFVLDPDGDGMSYFGSEEERDKFAKACIRLYLDDGWDENVIHVLGGKVTHRATQVNREDRPDDVEIDEDGVDLEGNHWDGDMEYKCNYELKPLKI